MVRWIKINARRLGLFLQGLGALTSPILGIVLKAEVPEKDWPAFVNAVVSYLHEYNFFFFVGAILCILIGYLLTKINDQWVLDQIQFILDECQKKIFSNHMDATGNPEPVHCHKVTLFKKVQWVWWFRAFKGGKKIFPIGGDGKPWDGWLIPYKRSGHTDQNSTILFRADGDDADKIEGVAGQSWASRRLVLVTNLPAITKSSTNQTISQYATTSHVSVDYIKNRKKGGKELPRSIGAMPIEVNSKPWGVIVFDSRLPEGVTSVSLQEFTLTVALIGRLLERVR